nr:hypothetical protein [Tanacetum cinerariifolium]
MDFDKDDKSYVGDDDEIKLEDLSELVKDLGAEAMDLDSPEDDQPRMISTQADDKAEATLLKAQPSFLNVQQLTELLVNSLKPELAKLLRDHDFNTSIPTELKELPFMVTKINKADIPVELLALLEQVSSINAQLSKLKVLYALPNFLNRVVEALDRFATAVDSTSQKVSVNSVPSAGQASVDVVKKMYMDKIKYDKYCLMMLNRKAQGKIINYDMLSRGKGPITLKVYRDDGLEEIIQNFKASDLELELELDLSKPLEEQDLILKLNLLAKKKRKNADDLYDYFKSTKRYKKSVQFSDFQAGIVLNEPSLRMILFNSKQRQDFISIKDFDELNNKMLYNIQEIFFRHHKGLGIDYLARNFSSLSVAKVDKRNLNPNKQMRMIEQIRQ